MKRTLVPLSFFVCVLLALSSCATTAGNAFTISGTVIDINDNPVPGVTVCSHTGVMATTNGIGRYTLPGLTAGSYAITPSRIGYYFSPNSQLVEVPSDKSEVDFLGYEEVFVRRPVILLPGMGSSANWDCFLWERDCDDPDAWTWMPSRFFPIAIWFYKPLIDQFEKAGYKDDYFTVLLYDWTKPLTNNVIQLRAKIEEVKSRTGSENVDLIGHSMGGLVGRAYIQDDSYEEDVAHLITLGSPHKGAAKAYPFWQAANYYEISIIEEIGFFIIMKKHASEGEHPVETLRRVFPSFRDILPSSDYLFDEKQGDQVKPERGMVHRNLFLKGLNDGLVSLFERSDVSVMFGNGINTTVRFYVYDRSLKDEPNWDDGIPNWKRNTEFLSEFGDLTVAVESATLPCPAHVWEFDGVDHGSFSRNKDVVQAIFTSLGIPDKVSDEFAWYSETPPMEVIILVLDGDAQAKITDPLGRSVGPVDVSIPGAEYLQEPSDPFQLIIIPSPEDGLYKIVVYSMETGRFELSLLDTFTPLPALITDPSTRWDTVLSDMTSGSEMTFFISYSSETPETTTLLHAPE